VGQPVLCCPKSDNLAKGAQCSSAVSRGREGLVCAKPEERDDERERDMHSEEGGVRVEVETTMTRER
jgi:hypothetical protein